MALTSPARDGGENRYYGSFRDRSIETFEVPNVVVVAVHIYELVQISFLVEKVGLEARVTIYEVRKNLAHGEAVPINRRLAIGTRPHNGWYFHFYCHT